MEPYKHSDVDSHALQLVSLHVAEYQTLTTRSTYWMTMQFGLVPVLGIFLAFVAQAWSTFSHLKLVWSCVFVVEAVVVQWYQAGLEQYYNIRYIETTLRPKLVKLLGPSDFWAYETYLKSQRNNGSVVWWEYPPSVVS